MVTLSKDVSRDFVILNLADTQMDGAYLDINYPDRIHLFETITTLVKRVKPQLITLSGDYCYGDCEGYFDVLRCFGDFIESFEIPWALVWGNHDNQGGKEVICKAVELFSEYPHFVYESGDPSLGNGNYVIEIKEGERTVEGIIMMDTHNLMPYTHENGQVGDAWAKLLPEQLDWYEEQVKALFAKGCNDTVLITHIPIYAYREAFPAALKEGVDPLSVKPEESANPDLWNDGYKDSFGVQYEGVCSYPADEGAMDRIVKLKSTKICLCGHDHVNNWVIKYKGVLLAYGLKTGRGCYFNKALNGGTVLTVKSDGHTDIRHEYVNIG